MLSLAKWSPRKGAAILLRLLVERFVAPGKPLVFGIDETLERRWGSKIKARGIYRDSVRSSHSHIDGDGFCEVHVNTQEDIWPILRSWLRPHREICQERLPIYLGFFEFVYNTRRRGKALLADLFETILAPDQRLLADICPAA